MKKTLQTGFAHLGSVLLLVVVVLIGLIGYKVWSNNHTNSVSNSTTSVTTKQVPPINNTSDLNKAESTLNQENVDGDLNPDSLNQDVNSLL